MLREYHTSYAMPITIMKLHNCQVIQTVNVGSTMLRTLGPGKRNPLEEGEHFIMGIFVMFTPHKMLSADQTW
jgi:hypothetical protein